MAFPGWLQPIHTGVRVTVTTLSGEFIIGILTNVHDTEHRESIILDDKTLIPWHAIATITKHRETP